MTGSIDWDAAIAAALELHRAGRLEEADRLYRAVLAQDPEHADALHLSGLVADTLGDTARAIGLIERALAVREVAPFRFSLGAAFSRAGRHEAAVAAFERALALGMDGFQTLWRLGAEYNQVFRWFDAEAMCRRALEAEPRHGDAWYQLAVTLYHQGRMEETLEACAASLGAAPGGSGALTYRGHALRGLGRLEESEAVLRGVLEGNPGDFAAHNNLALTLEAQGRGDAALAALDAAIALAPDNPQCRNNRGTLLLRAGRMTEGWADYEARLLLDPHDRTHARFAGRRPWEGEALEGRTILLMPEQGAGDAIMFSRYAEPVAARGGRVIMGVQAGLRRLFGTLAGVEALVDIDEAPKTDVYCPLMSLPRVLGTTLETVPAVVPYLRGEAGAVRRWAGRLEGEGLRVGLVWAGNPDHGNDRRRSMPVAAVSRLLEVPGVRWFSLQVGRRAGEVEGRPGVEVLTAELTDFAETAAVMEGLDLVITVDTSAAHLAGALGRRVWVLLPYVADWRWLTGRETTPWYPTMRLFRQDEGRDWEVVVGRVVEELRGLVCRR